MYGVAIVIIILLLVNITLTIMNGRKEKTQEILYDPKSNSIKITSKRLSSKKHKIIKNSESMEAEKEARLNERTQK